MLIRPPEDIRPSEITDRALYLRRREIIKGGAALVAAAGLGLRASRAAAGERYAGVPRSPLSTGEEQTEREDATRYNNFYEFGTDKRDPARHAGSLKTRPWHVAVEGQCERPGSYDLEDLIRPGSLAEYVYRLRCVEAWSMVIPWVGMALGETLGRFKPTSKAKYVAFETLYDPEQMPGQRRRVLDWPYREGLRIDEAMHPLAILAVGMYGEVLPNQNGAPLRLVVPWKYGFKSIKSIVRIRFQETQPETSWNQAGPREYGFYSNVNPAVDHPRWSQKKERRIGDGIFTPKRKTLPFNGYGEQVADLYRGMDLKKYY